MNFVKNEIFKMLILSKMSFSKCDFLDTLRIFALVCGRGLLVVVPKNKVDVNSVVNSITRETIFSVLGQVLA